MSGLSRRHAKYGRLVVLEGYKSPMHKDGDDYQVAPIWTLLIASEKFDLPV
jgi:hypothetical protein